MEVRVCAVDTHPLFNEITGWIGEGKTANFIENQTRGLGKPIKRETVRNHMNYCLGGVEHSKEHARTLQKIVKKAEEGAPPEQVKRDFAEAVQKEALQKLKDGHLRVTTKDGLVAQQLIDKREERAKDRAFVLDLARLLSGAGAPPPDEYIDGEYVEMGDDDEVPLLAPPELRDGA